MGHNIDLNQQLPRTDLAIDLIEENKSKTGFQKEVKQNKHCKVTTVTLDKNGVKVIGKKPGHYITIEFDDITDHDW